LSGFTELMAVTMCNPSGAGASVNCEVPGNKNEGYCRLNDQILHVCPASFSALHNRSLKVVMPPGRNGCAGPMMMIFLGLPWYTDFYCTKILWNADFADETDKTDLLLRNKVV